MDLKEKVYFILTLIPAGRVATYGQIAECLGNKKLSRVVGNILHVNPDPIGHPCFKVVNRCGRLATNFGGGGPDVQKVRLENDGVRVIDGYVNLKEYGMKTEELKSLFLLTTES